MVNNPAWIDKILVFNGTTMTNNDNMKGISPTIWGSILMAYYRDYFMECNPGN